MPGWIYTPDGRTIEKGSEEHYEYLAGKGKSCAVSSDEDSFVSPIDRKVYHGRAGMREHNRIHNVVNNRDLVGLPPLTTHRPPPVDRKAVRGAIVEAMKMKGIL